MKRRIVLAVAVIAGAFLMLNAADAKAFHHGGGCCEPSCCCEQSCCAAPCCDSAAAATPLPFVWLDAPLLQSVLRSQLLQ